MRDDPFFNNVKGARSALNTAIGSLHCEYPLDGAGCAGFEARLLQTIRELWQHSDGGPATNFLAGWSTAALVVSVDLDLVTTGGTMLAVWGAVQKAGPPEPVPGARDGGAGAVPPRPQLGAQMDRAGRALVAQALVGLLATDAERNRRKEEYNAAGSADWAQFATDLQAALPLYDALNGRCGDQWLAGVAADPAGRYGKLAAMLADDRLWIDSRTTTCDRYLAVELAVVDGIAPPRVDCGGRTPSHDAVDVFRSLLADGTVTSVSDGVERDDRVHSTSVFPFLAAPCSSSG